MEEEKAMNYVCGFMFSRGWSQLALIRKAKPAWQRGKLNGIGGKIEDGESPMDAMLREFKEETGHQTRRADWNYFLRMAGVNDGGEGNFQVDFFACTGDLRALQTTEAEKLEIINTQDVFPLRSDMIENLPWLIGLALDHMNDGRPTFTECRYV